MFLTAEPSASLDIFRWWLLLFFGGLAFFPLTRKIFKNTADGGYPFAKILALTLTSYPLWLLGSLKLLPFASSPLWLLLIPPLVVLLIFHAFPNNKSQPITTSHNQLPPVTTGYAKLHRLRIVIFEEFLFLAAFSFWLFIRSHEPSLQSLEKPMDFGIINSLLRSDFFPPKDMWLAGYNLNYYYYGHFVVALLIKLTGVLPEIGYNLMLATLFALTFTAAFSFGINLYSSFNHTTTRPQHHKTTTPQVLLGLLTAFSLTLFGNLHPLYALLKGTASYWYPDATRFIERTIHEFPIYSFVVADLHGHLLDLPFVLLTIFLLRQIWLETGPALMGLLGLLLALLYMTNSADALIYGALFFLLVSGKSLIQTSVLNLNINTLEYRTRLILRQITTPTAIALLTVSPFLLTFKPFVGGLSFAPEHSPFWQLLILWGGFLPFSAGFLFYFFRQTTRPHDHKTSRLQPPITPTPQDAFVALLILSSLLLILFPEFFYFKDIYTTQPRANTLFKFSYQAFILLSLATPYLFFRIINFWERQRLKKLLWSLLFAAILIITSTYPFFAVRGFYGELSAPKALTLNGLKYLRQTSPDDYQAILWLKNNVKGQPVILEAVGESYTDFARVSANTGLPTVFGWPVHEWLWRKGNGFREWREPDVTTLYQTTDTHKAGDLLKKYDVKYVMVGQLERTSYPSLEESKFKKLGDLVFAAGNTHLYRVEIATPSVDGSQ